MNPQVTASPTTNLRLGGATQVRLGEHALVLASAREHQFVVVVIRAVLDVVPPESGSIGGFEHRRDWLP